MLARILMFFFIFVLEGCATTLPPIRYNGNVLHKSNLTASVKLNTGRVIGHSESSIANAGGIFVPVTYESTPELQFGKEDQRIFMESLRSELLKHKIIGSLKGRADNALDITVNFVRTEHFAGVHEYKITAIMDMKYQQLSEHKKYNISSSEGDSFFEKMNTSALKGKTKAAKKLLNAMIPDIESFVSRISR